MAIAVPVWPVPPKPKKNSPPLEKWTRDDTQALQHLIDGGLKIPPATYYVKGRLDAVGKRLSATGSTFHFGPAGFVEVGKGTSGKFTGNTLVSHHIQR